MLVLVMVMVMEIVFVQDCDSRGDAFDRSDVTRSFWWRR